MSSPTPEPTAAEDALIRWLSTMGELAHPYSRDRGTLAGWRFPGTAALILGQGRLFGPPARPLPPGERRDPNHVWSTALDYARARPGLAYVEGLAAASEGAAHVPACPHAWCAVNASAIEPTEGWPDDPSVYVGVPMRPDFVAELRERHGPGPILWDSPASVELCRTGVPDDALVDVGRPLPDLLRYAIEHATPRE